MQIEASAGIFRVSVLDNSLYPKRYRSGVKMKLYIGAGG